jgi:deoxyadenosine/deoxycytidine kinase
VDELKLRIERRLRAEGKVRESERSLLADSDTYLLDLNGLYEEFYPVYKGNKLRIESKDWKLVNDDGSIRYDSEAADALLALIEKALEDSDRSDPAPPSS